MARTQPVRRMSTGGRPPRARRTHSMGTRQHSAPMEVDRATGSAGQQSAPARPAEGVADSGGVVSQPPASAPTAMAAVPTAAAPASQTVTPQPSDPISAPDSSARRSEDDAQPPVEECHGWRLDDFTRAQLGIHPRFGIPAELEHIVRQYAAYTSAAQEEAHRAQPAERMMALLAAGVLEALTPAQANSQTAGQQPSSGMARVLSQLLAECMIQTPARPTMAPPSLPSHDAMMRERAPLRVSEAPTQHGNVGMSAPMYTAPMPNDANRYVPTPERVTIDGPESILPPRSVTNVRFSSDAITSPITTELPLEERKYRWFQLMTETFKTPAKQSWKKWSRHATELLQAVNLPRHEWVSVVGLKLDGPPADAWRLEIDHRTRVCYQATWDDMTRYMTAMYGDVHFRWKAVDEWHALRCHADTYLAVHDYLMQVIRLHTRMGSSNPNSAHGAFQHVLDHLPRNACEHIVHTRTMHPDLHDDHPFETRVHALLRILGEYYEFRTRAYPERSSVIDVGSAKGKGNRSLLPRGKCVQAYDDSLAWPEQMGSISPGHITQCRRTIYSTDKASRGQGLCHKVFFC